MKRRQQQPYGSLKQDHEYELDSDDVSATGTASDDYVIELDGDASPLKQNKHYNVVQYPHDCHVPQNTRHIHHHPLPFNDRDETPPNRNHLTHLHEAKDDRLTVAALSDTDSCPSHGDKVIEIAPKNTPQKPLKYTKLKYDVLLNKFLKYKNMALKQYLFPIKKNFMVFKFKKKNHRESFPIYIDKQYHTIHWISILIMILQIICLHYVHVKHNIHAIQQSFDATLDADDYVMFVFVILLCVLWLFAVISCVSCHPIFSEQSTTSFTLSIGIVLLYLIIIYTITANLSTEMFLIYFIVTLTFNTCMGYIKFMQYIILSFIVMVEFILCAALRWQHIITIGIQDTEGQITGIITDTQFYFGTAMVLFVCLFNGYHVYQTQQRLSYEYIQTSRIYEYAKTNHFSNKLEQILDSEITDKHGNIMMDPYKYTDMNEEEEDPSYVQMNAIQHNNNVHIINGCDHDMSHNDEISSLEKVNKIHVISINQNQTKPKKKNGIYSDDDELSMLSSLHLPKKIEHVIANQSHSSSDSSDDVDVKLDLNESIRYSLSTTTPLNHTPLHLHTLAPTATQAELEMESIQFMEVEEQKEREEESLDEEPFIILSLIAHCKYLAEKAGQAITEIYHVIDGYDNIAYDEKRSFQAIDQLWIKNKQKKYAAKNASKRGMSNNKRKRKQADSDDAPQSPFKERLPLFIKNTRLFQFTPEIAAKSLAFNMMETSLRLHFPEAMNRVKYPNKVNMLEVNSDILPPGIQVDDIIRGQTKLLTENGKNVQREIIQHHPDKVEYFRNIEQKDLIIWIEPLDGADAISKKDKETQASVTVLIGIADARTKKSIAGIIHRPFTNETVVGIPDIGVYTYNFNVNPLFNSKHHSKRVVVAKYNDIVKEYLQKCCPQNIRDALIIEGGIGNNVLLLMENECDVFLHPDHDNTHKYHICAIEAVIDSLGGDFTQINGKRYEYSDLTTKLKKGFVATLYGPEYHQQFQYKQYFG